MRITPIMLVLLFLISVPIISAQDASPSTAITVNNIAQVGALNVLSTQGDVGAVTVSPDGTFIAAGNFTTGQLWDAASGEAAGILQGHNGGVTSIAFSSDSTTLATASRDATARLWRNLGDESVSLMGHNGEVLDVAFNASGTLLATASTDRTIRLWDVMTGTLSLIFEGHEGAVNAAVFSPVENLLATGGADHTIRLWNADDGIMIATLTGHEAPVNALAFSPDGTLLASASDDATVRLWRVREQDELMRIEGHESPVLAVAFSPDGDVLASAGFDRVVRLWNASSGAPLGILRGHENVITAITFDPMSGRLVTGSADRSVRIWGARGGSSSGIVGTVNRAVEAVYNPNEAETCPIASGDSIFAIGRAETHLLLYTNGVGCEGAVWLPHDALGSIAWLDVTPEVLPIVDTPSPPQIIRDLPEYDALCADPTDEARLRSGPPHTIFDPITPRSMYPTALLANTNDGVDVVLCMRTVNTPVDMCEYGEDIVVPLARPDVIIQLVSFESGAIAAQNTFEGTVPDVCPESIPISGQIGGTAVDNDVWLPWVIMFLQGDGANDEVRVPRTVVNVNNVNVRRGAGTEFRVIGQVNEGDAVNIVGRNPRGDWAVVLLPDMTFGWISASLLRIADRTDLLATPEYRGVADEFQITLP